MLPLTPPSASAKTTRASSEAMIFGVEYMNKILHWSTWLAPHRAQIAPCNRATCKLLLPLLTQYRGSKDP